MLPRVHLVDGTFELYRAHFSKRPDILDGSGRDVKATLGVVRSMIALTREADESVTHLAIAFDNPITCFRNELFDGYKTDEGVPAVLRSQFDLVEEACAAVGLTVWSMKDFEADDGLASGAARFRDEASQIRILSPDKDLGQCLVDKVVQIDRIRKKVTDAEAFEKARGFSPRAVPDWLALVGDTADGIPGVKGFGDKTAAALLRTFSRLEDIPHDAAAWPKDVRGAPRLAEALRNDFDAATLYKRLATLSLDAPISKSLDDLKLGSLDTAGWRSFVTKLGHPDYASWAEENVP